VNDDFNFERRLLLAFTLAAMAYLIFFPLLAKKRAATTGTPAAAPTAIEAPGKTTPTPAAPQSGSPGGNVRPSVVAAATPAGGAIAAATEQTVTVESASYRVVFSNRGAVVRSWVLTGYTDASNRPLELVDDKLAAQNGYPLSLWTPEAGPRTAMASGLYQVTTAAGAPVTGNVKLAAPAHLEFRWSNGSLAVTKDLDFDASFVTHITTSVALNGVPQAHQIAWTGDFGDRTEANHAATLHPFDDTGDSLKLLPLKKDSPPVATQEGAFRFSGLEDQYFALAFLPLHSGPQTLDIFHTRVDSATGLVETPNPDGSFPDTKKPLEIPGLAVGEGGSNDYRLFVGPKKIDLLNSIDPELRKLVDFGWFSIVAEPIFLAMKWLYGHWIHNYGWVIIALTFFINLAIFPLRLKGQKSQAKMMAIQPRLQPLNDKMKRYPMRDPRRQEIQQQVMKIYQEEGINPMGGCLPMLLQLPLLYAFYRVLAGSIELRHAPWIGYLHDLSARDPYYILPLLMIGAQFWSMTLIPPAPGQDPMQAKMMKYIMPIGLGYIFFFLPSGVNLYYLTSNLLSVGQQTFINRTMPVAIAKKRA